MGHWLDGGAGVLSVTAICVAESTDSPVSRRKSFGRVVSR